MLNFQNDMTQLIDMIDHAANHPYLLKYIDNPIVDLDKLKLLLLLSNEANITEKERDAFVISTMLIQIALDTHEKVSLSKVDVDTAEELKNRQLTVLAGDYYSGLYYRILADIENMSLIRQLAAAIKNINEDKIKLYQNTFHEPYTLLDTIKTIEAGLVTQLADYLQASVWKEFSENLLLLQRLKTEIQYIQKGQNTLFLTKMREILSGNMVVHEDQQINLFEFICSITEKIKEKTAALIEEAPISPAIKSQVLSIFELIKVDVNSFSEEG